MSVSFPSVDCSLGQSFPLEHHIFIFALKGESTGLPEIQIVRCPPAPGEAVSVVAQYALRTNPLVALKVHPNNGQPLLCVQTLEHPGVPPDIEVEIIGLNAQTSVQFWQYENKMDAELFLGTDDQRVDCLRTGPGYSKHSVNTRFTLSKADVALGFDPAGGRLRLYYRLLPGTSGGYVRLFERNSL